MLKAVRLVLVALAALLAIPAATVHAAQRMPIGFFDDPSFRWSATRDQNLQLASSEGASVIHTTAAWAALAPTKPADPANGDDPAYKLTDLDDLVFQAGLHNLRVMINITGTPKWANGGKAPNVMPKKLGDLTTFSKMLATRYNGAHRARFRLALVGLERTEPAALPDAAVRRARRSSARRTTRSSTRRPTPGSRRATRSRRSRSARRRPGAATSRSRASAPRSRRARSRTCSRRSRGSSSTRGRITRTRPRRTCRRCRRSATRTSRSRRCRSSRAI